MARIRRFQSSADDLTSADIVEEIMAGPTGDPRDLERMRRYYGRRGELGSVFLLNYEAEHRAMVASGSPNDWHSAGRAAWLRGRAVTK